MKYNWIFVSDGEETIALKSKRYDDACREVLRIKHCKVFETTTGQWRFEQSDGSCLPLSTDSELEAIEEGLADFLYGEVLTSEDEEIKQ